MTTSSTNRSPITTAPPARPTPTTTLKLGLPKGRMSAGVLQLMADAGVAVRLSDRGYRPSVSLPGIEAKILKPQNIVEMLVAGSRDIGFAGADWVSELNANLVEIFDTTLDAVRLVAAVPPGVSLDSGQPLIVASEYERLTRDWIAARKLSATFVHSYGATEVFPPDDADCIVDIAASGDTLRANNLTIVDELATSSTRLYANPDSMCDPKRRAAIDRFVLLLRSALEARRRVMVEVNVSEQALESVVATLPCMRNPTISRLHDGAGYAVKAAVPRERLALLIPEIKACGGTDIVVTTLSQLIP